MLEIEYLKQLLQRIGAAKYTGIESNYLVYAALGENFSDEEFLKLKYHMDEIWEAGLIKGRDGPGKNGWGYQGKPPRMMLIPIPLVLTPIGSELLQELNKPKGLERLKTAMRSVGGIAGSEALKAAIGALLKGAIS
ncbi:hypothetical protein [Salinicola rhizosphaerae]|uniref:DUF2513 domain-containing protein n=1 Tax=Salinicola rhizosphaerae TaxID=1443141 RepID=A0ABQ3E2V5_9GAMM|nr:hypothetical protein [Salinicola rhizosphaerae]GHB24534.1 hypothetical protein GCM10009038_24520 [Salinicola rhizosphaerae]